MRAVGVRAQSVTALSLRHLSLLQGGGDHDELRETEAELFADADKGTGATSASSDGSSPSQLEGSALNSSPRGGSAPMSSDLEEGKNSASKGGKGAIGRGSPRTWAIFTQVRP